MQLTKTHKIIISVAVLTLLLGIYISLDKKYRNVGPEIKATTTNNSNASTTVIMDDKGNKIIMNGSGYTIEQVPLNEGKLPTPIPNLDRPLTLYPGVVIASEAKAEAEKQVKILQTALKKNPADFDSWINLGLYQKAGGDYEGAILSWKYASRLAPKDFISISNLGTLHAFYLKDNGMAETYFLEAIKRAPREEYLYFQIVELYRDIFKDITKARVIVDQGLKVLPNSANLQQLRTSLN